MGAARGPAANRPPSAESSFWVSKKDEVERQEGRGERGEGSGEMRGTKERKKKGVRREDTKSGVPEGGCCVESLSPFSTEWHTFIEFIPCQG